MKTESITLNKSDAQAIHKELSTEGKKIMDKILPKDFFKSDITDRVNTLKDVIAIAKPTKEELALINYKGTSDHMLGAQNFLICELVSEVLNEGWVAPFDGKTPRWFPVFDVESGGFGFLRADDDNWHSTADAGSRLCLKNEPLAIHAGKIFGEYYRKIIIKNYHKNFKTKK